MLLQYRRKRKAAVVLQAQLRGHLARKEWKRRRDAVILLQAHTRGMLARKALKRTNVGSAPPGSVCSPQPLQDVGLRASPDASLLQMLLSAKQIEEERRLMLERQAHLEEVLRQAREAEAKAGATDQEIVDSFFDFLPLMSAGRESPGFEVP